MCDDRSDVVEPMDGLDVDARFRREIPPSTEGRGQI